MEESAEERRPKRQKRESSYKAKAFEKFKQLKSGKRNKYEDEEVDNIYDTVEESEYVKKVLQRQDDDWIVDDDGSGYVEDGRDIFDDDLDMESIAAASKNKQGTKRKKKGVAENAGKGKLSFMLSNMPTKKKKEEKLESDDVLSELLEEIDENPQSTLKPKPISSGLSEILAKKAEKNYLKSFSAPKVLTPKLSKSDISSPKVNSVELQNKPKEKSQIIKKIEESEPKNVLVEIQNTPKIPESNLDISEDIIESSMMKEAEDSVLTETQISMSQTSNNDGFDDDFDITQIEEFESQIENKEEEDVGGKVVEDLANWFSGDFEAVDEENDIDAIIDDVKDQDVFRFFWLDAFEDIYKQPGVVFLFGKTLDESSKSYVSCCVAVRDIERKLFFLPKPYDEAGHEITSQDVYKEINEAIMKPLQIKHFKARPISKKYAFDPTVPAESDYVEVRYSAKDPKITTTSGRTFSRIFGIDSSYLEILLLDRKIKGPCWLDVRNTVKVTNPLSWCKVEVDCHKVSDVTITPTEGKNLPPPPLIVAAINLRRCLNQKTSKNEIVMLSCVVNNKYAVDKQAPKVPFNEHFCVFTSPDNQILPLNLHSILANFKGTKVQKMDTEKALLNYFITQFARLDCDLIVGHDLQGYQINVLSERLVQHQINNFSKFGRIKRSLLQKQKLERELFVGRLVCDVKISAKELIKSRSYDLDTLCQTVLKIKDGDRIDLEPEDIPKMFKTPQDILKLVSLTMQDTAFILKMMYQLNIIPLALQITNIAGNVMSKTLMGGRSERNEFLLLHAFTEKGYIVPDKIYKKKEEDEKKVSRKKPTYSGGLVLEPKVGFYDKLILLMDFNSLYPSIIQEYNLCFTTMPPGLSEDNMVLPDSHLPAGVLPTEIRKLVESRREVKKLMTSSDLSNDLKIQYHIRQMALKLTANSMYGCLGFSHSRFYAKNLAALVTHKGREILTNTRDLVQKMNFDVIYGDTDSIMILTNLLDYDQVLKIGLKIKQEVNKHYKQVELDIDGVFKYLLLLKKKKYAAVTLSKKNNELRSEIEYKGIDIVRRDWSSISSEAGKFVLRQILSDLSPDDRIAAIHAHLTKLKEDLHAGRVPLSLLVITKQLTKNPELYTDKNALPHVQVALRYNKECGGHLRAGDTVPYIICDDGTQNSATQRGYHVEELKNSKTLKVDVNYYLGQQIHPVVSRICEPIEGTDAFQIAECLGLDTSSFKRPKQEQQMQVVGENIVNPEIKYRNAKKFVFKCTVCKTENKIEGPLEGTVSPFLLCSNVECSVRPLDYSNNLKNQLVSLMNSYIKKYYLYEMYCEDPMCSNETRRLPLHFIGRFPMCTLCKNSVLLKKYTETDLYTQLSYFQYIFDLSKIHKKPILEQQVENFYNEMRETVESRLRMCAYSIIDLEELYCGFSLKTKDKQKEEEEKGDDGDDDSGNVAFIEENDSDSEWID